MRCFISLALTGSILTAPAFAQGPSFAVTTAEVDAFVEADVNTDGKLNKAEFKTFVRAMAESGQSTARQIRMFRAYWLAFGITDKNKDGFVSPIELRSADDNHRAGTGPIQN